MRFAYRLAGYLKMRVGELMETMDSREFAYWQAMHRYYEPIGGEWDQVGLLASAALAPYCKPGQTPDPRDFVPVDKPPQHQIQIDDNLRRLKEDLGK